MATLTWIWSSTVGCRQNTSFRSETCILPNPILQLVPRNNLNRKIQNSRGNGHSHLDMVFYSRLPAEHKFQIGNLYPTQSNTSTCSQKQSESENPKFPWKWPLSLGYGLLQ